MTFETIFDAGHQGFGTTWVGLTFTAAGALFVFEAYRLRRSLPSGLRRASRMTLSWCLLIFSLFLTAGSLISTILQERLAKLDLGTRHFSIVSGPITGFHPAPHTEQSFVVQGRRFSCPATVVASDFQHGPFYGSPIRDGLQARITYSGNLILRLEIAH